MIKILRQSNIVDEQKVCNIGCILYDENYFLKVPDPFCMYFRKI